MKYNKEDTYEEWLDKVQVAELEYARKLIANGHPVELVLEKMAERIANKAMYPLLIGIREKSIIKLDK